MLRRTRRVLGVIVATLLAMASVASPSFAANEVVQGATNYRLASTALGGEVVLWRPSYTAGLSLKGPIDVIAYGSRTKRATFAGATYGKRIPSFTMAQKNAAHRWAATPIDHEIQGLVDTVAVRIGDPTSKRIARVRIYADCQVEGASNTRLGRCERRDVAQFGGTLILLARSSRDGRATASDIRIDSVGLSYAQLLRIARGLVPVSG